jgi:hypothetical protein
MLIASSTVCWGVEKCVEASWMNWNIIKISQMQYILHSSEYQNWVNKNSLNQEHYDDLTLYIPKHREKFFQKNPVSEMLKYEKASVWMNKHK